MSPPSSSKPLNYRLLVESKLMSFTAGFKLAWGMAKELEADGLYSFEREEEERICHPAEQED